MRLSLIGIVLCCTTATAALADQTLEAPVGEILPYALDSGVRPNKADTESVVYAQSVNVAGAAWIRLYFETVALGKAGRLRMTSKLDGEMQELDELGLNMWSRTSAYFNGDEVILELIAGPRSDDNRLILGRVAAEFGSATPRGSSGQCGICGTDDRTPSSELWSGRLLPVGCTASVFDPLSCLVSAGHCADGQTSLVIQFNVPNSNGDCSLNNPPIADQFPITNNAFVNGGVGNDWSVLNCGTNNLGQKPFQRYGAMRSIASTVAPSGQTVAMWGYGVDQTCTRTQTQQTANGPINSVNSSYYQFSVDLRGGNSGSGLIRTSTNEIIGVVTHCTTNCPNVATRVDLAAFAAARTALCVAGGGLPANDNCANAIPVGTGTFPFSSSGATTDGPNEPTACNFFSYTQVGSDIWYRYAAPCTGTTTASICDANYDSKLAVYSGSTCPSTASAIACNDDACGTSGTRSQVTFSTTNGQQYLVRIGGYNGATGNGNLVLSCSGATGPPNDACANAIPVGNGTTSFTTVNAATDGPDEPGLCAYASYSQVGADVWYDYTASCTGNVTVDLCNSTFDTKLAIYAGTICPTQSSAIACNDDACGTDNLRSLLVFPATAGQHYRIRIGGYNAATGTGSMVISCAATCGLLGDINGDGHVRGNDIGGYLRAKLGLAPLAGENQACANYGTGTLAGDNAMFVTSLLTSN